MRYRKSRRDKAEQAAPHDSENPYTRLFTRDRSFAELSRRANAPQAARSDGEEKAEGSQQP